jgi:hypothetical protein
LDGSLLTGFDEPKSSLKEGSVQLGVWIFEIWRGESLQFSSVIEIIVESKIFFCDMCIEPMPMCEIVFGFVKFCNSEVVEQLFKLIFFFFQTKTF